jgi:hypothetical protein
MQAIPKFGFYEKVRVKTSDLAKSHLNGEVGAVLGRTETEEHPDPFLYAVSIDSLGRTWSLFESELEPTGQWAKREDYETGHRVRVRVDERGRGTKVPQDEGEVRD